MPEDLPRRPKSSPRRTDFGLEQLVVKEGRTTSFRYRRLTSYLRKKYSLTFSEHTIRAILRRNKVGRKVVRTKTGSVRHLYDYEHLSPFREFQLDTKHLLDQKALPVSVYDHLMHTGLPLYEWHLMDAATRTRFLAYSSSSSGSSPGYGPTTCGDRSG